MSSFGLKGGIGTASRRVPMAGAGEYTVGALVLANFGKLAQLVVAGHAIGDRLAASWRVRRRRGTEPEKGSIILLLATDAPLDARQLRRLALRAGAGLARTGSVFGHGSGDIALAFSTAYTVPLDRAGRCRRIAMLHDGLIDGLFRRWPTVANRRSCMRCGAPRPVTGRDGHHRAALADLLAGWTSLSDSRRSRESPMKILISTDIEGVAGVFHPQQTRAGNPEYERARLLMTHEANAAIAGAFDGGRHRGAGQRLARRLPQHAAGPARRARPDGDGQAALPEHDGRRGRGRERRLHDRLSLARAGPRRPGAHHQQLRVCPCALQ